MGLAFYPFTGFHRLLHSPFIPSWVFTVFQIRLSSLCGRRRFPGCLYACTSTFSCAAMGLAFHPFTGFHRLLHSPFIPSRVFTVFPFVTLWTPPLPRLSVRLYMYLLAARPRSLPSIPLQVFTVFPFTFHRFVDAAAS